MHSFTLNIGSYAGVFFPAKAAAPPAEAILHRPIALALPFLESSSSFIRQRTSPTLLIAVVIGTFLVVLLIRIYSQRRRAVEALHQKESELDETQSLAHVGTWHWNPKTDTVAWSRALFDLTGCDPAQPAPPLWRLSQFFTPAVHEQLLQSMKKLLTTGAPFEMELLGHRPDGIERWVIVRGEAVRDINGYVHLQGTVQDITEQKLAKEERLKHSVLVDLSDDAIISKDTEQELVESERRFRLMADAAPVLMWLSGPDKRCTDFNKEWLRFTGRTLKAELGEGWTANVHPDDLDACYTAYALAFDSRQSFTIEYRLKRHDQKYRWLLNQGVPRFHENGDFAGYIGSCVDITDEKEAKTARIELSGRLIRAQEEERTRIARELHDDINQRLALLANGLQEFGQASVDSDESRQQQLRDLSQLTCEIATDIQHMSHELHPAKLHYLGLAAAVRDLCQVFSRQHKIQIECVVRELPHDLNEAVSLSLFRTVQESLHNVAKHSHAHHVKVELNGGQGAVRLRVSDDGVGFNPDLLTDNCGLGLMSMRERLRSVGGEFSVWSRPALGTQVEGTVPATAKLVGTIQPALSQRL